MASESLHAQNQLRKLQIWAEKSLPCPVVYEGLV